MQLFKHDHQRKANARGASGFTLIEILIVVAIIIFLVTIVGAIGFSARDKARISHTKVLLKVIHSALDVYKCEYHCYPVNPLSDDNFKNKGVQITRTFIDQYRINLQIPKTDWDATNTFIIDSWSRPILYRRPAPQRMLLWSVGADGKDQIGLGPFERSLELKTGGGTGKPGTRPGTSLVPKGDDISNVEMDY